SPLQTHPTHTSPFFLLITPPPPTSTPFPTRRSSDLLRAICPSASFRLARNRKAKPRNRRCGRNLSFARDGSRPSLSVVLHELPLVARQRIVERLDERVRVDVPAGKLFPGRENLLLLHLVERFATAERLLDHRGGFFQHFRERFQVLHIRKRAMSGNHSYVGRQLRRDLFRGGDHALDA